SAAITQLDQNSSLQIGCSQAPPAANGVNILAGVVHIFTHNPGDLQVCAPFVNAGIHGTEFLVEVAATTRITVFEGVVTGVSTRTNATMEVASIGAPRSATWGAAGASAPTEDMRARDRLRWSLHYLPLFLGNEPGL